jgi:hypothetical protein
MRKKVSPSAEKSNGKVKLPKGFKAIVGGDSWKPEKEGENILGVLAAVELVHMPEKGKTPARDVNKYTIKTKEGEVVLWQSAGLTALEKVKKGTAVYIEYLGSEVYKKGQAPMRKYTVATK